MSHKISHYRNLFVFLICWLLVGTGCGTPPDAYDFTDKQIESPTAPIIAKESPRASLTQKPETQTPTLVTKTITPTFTNAVLPPTFTQISQPTLSIFDTNELVLELLRTNGGCDFPCWWGLNPGQMDYADVKSMMSALQSESNTFAEENAEYKNSGDFLIRIDQETIIQVWSNMVFHPSTQKPGILELLWIRTELLREIPGGFKEVLEDPFYDEVFHDYTLQAILAKYGKPEQVLVLGNTGWGSLEVLLYYPENGMVAMFWPPLERDDDQYVGCLWKAFTDLYLWDPETEYTWSEAVSQTTGGGEAEWLNAGFLPLEEATSLTLDKFYAIYKEPQNTACLETPIGLWPGP